MTLRQKVIEAGARAMFDADDAYGWEWDDYDEGVHGWYRRMSAVQTDAKLDCLTENADEWFDSPERSVRDRVDIVTMDHLLAVLREDR